MPQDRLASLRDRFGGAALHPLTLTVSPGRAGTLFLCAWLQENCPGQAIVTHEGVSHRVARPGTFFRPFDEAAMQEALAHDPLYEWLGELLGQAAEQPVVETGHYAISAIPIVQAIAPQALRVLLLHRHPVASAGSHAIKGHYRDHHNPAWAIYPTHPRARFPEYQSRWDAMTPYECELYRWLETTAYGLELAERFPNTPHRVAAAGDLFTSVDTRRELARFFGLEPAADEVVSGRGQNATIDRNRELRPIGEEWRRTTDHTEVVALAESLGYDMDKATIQREAAKYLRPPGVMPLVRRVTGYWHARWWLGKTKKRLLAGSDSS